MSGSRNKKNWKKINKTNLSEILQYNSAKFETNKNGSEKGVKSDDSLRKRRKVTILKRTSEDVRKSESITEIDENLLKNLKTLNLGDESMTAAKNPDEELPLVMEYCPEEAEPSSYKYSKNSKSIKFTNQVTVLHFNGEDILFESMEPLKKEQDQLQRNKEMRKEHLMSKGLDNLCLF